MPPVFVTGGTARSCVTVHVTWCPASRKTRTAFSRSSCLTSTWSVSYVETANMLMPAVASGVANPANTPTIFRSKGPRTANIDHGPSATTPEGTTPASHTTDSSAGVRVTEKNAPCVTQGGSPSSGGKRQSAYEPGITSSVSGVGSNEPTAPIRRQTRSIARWGCTTYQNPAP